jgi:regulator of sigma E protease
MTVIRKSQPIDISVTVPESGLLGIAIVGDYKRFFKTNLIHYTLLESIPAGIKKGFTASSDYLKQFKLIFSRETKGYESLGGFITIGSIFPRIWDWHSFWSLTAFLSIILAIMNVLPIPALDGGHVLFLLYEIVTGRKPSDKFLEYAQITGMILILALLLYANGNDVVKLVKGWIHH